LNNISFCIHRFLFLDIANIAQNATFKML